MWSRAYGSDNTYYGRADAAGLAMLDFAVVEGETYFIQFAASPVTDYRITFSPLPEPEANHALLNVDLNATVFEDGDTLRIDYDVLNVGDAAGAGGTATLFIANADFSGLQARDTERWSGLETAEVDGERLEFIVSGDNFESGEYVVFVLLDPDDDVAEADAFDLLSTFEYVTFDFGENLADLVITDIELASTQIVEDADNDLTFTVVNEGLVATQETGDVYVYISEDNILDTDDDALVWVEGHTVLEVDEVDDESFDLQNALDGYGLLGQGDYTLFIVVDPLSTVAERDENNVYSLNITYEWYTFTDNNDDVDLAVARTVDALGGNDRVDGTEGDDVIHGGDGSDDLDGNGGDDRLFGDDGDDK